MHPRVSRGRRGVVHSIIIIVTPQLMHQGTGKQQTTVRGKIQPALGVDEDLSE